MPLCCTALHPSSAFNFLEGPWSFTLASVKHACPLTQQLHFWADAQLSLNYATDVCWVPTRVRHCVGTRDRSSWLSWRHDPGKRNPQVSKYIQTVSERWDRGCGRIPGHWAESSRGQPWGLSATVTQKEVTPEQDQVRDQGEPAGRGGGQEEAGARPDSAQHYTAHEKNLGFIFRRLFQQECGKEIGRGTDQSQHLGAVTRLLAQQLPRGGMEGDHW